MWKILEKYVNQKTKLLFLKQWKKCGIESIGEKSNNSLKTLKIVHKVLQNISKFQINKYFKWTIKVPGVQPIKNCEQFVFEHILS